MSTIDKKRVFVAINFENRLDKRRKKIFKIFVNDHVDRAINVSKFINANIKNAIQYNHLNIKFVKNHAIHEIAKKLTKYFDLKNIEKFKIIINDEKCNMNFLKI